ncbi:MAG: hypothetical protein FWF24_03795 [Alphaproteobacteria bacterium]|nr:hypothetical protein [Alphaproteobacteria bacterium]
MTSKILYWTTSVCAALALLLLLTIMYVVCGNRTIQQTINDRQSKINLASTTVGPLNVQLSNALFAASQEKKDAAVRELLVSLGFQLPEQASKPAVTKQKPSKTTEE